MPKILVIDDDVLLAQVIDDSLTAENFVVEIAHNGTDGLALLKQYEYDAIVVDWQMPDIEGIEVITEYQKRGGVSPIIMLTGKDTITDKETGLNSGADDYLTKPFSTKELIARIRALLRRPRVAPVTVLAIGHVKLDPVKRKCTVAEKEVSLLPREYSLLEHLMRHPGQIFNSEALLDRVWDSASDVGPETVRTCIMRLRKKIDIEGQEPILETLYGVGYRIKG